MNKFDLTNKKGIQMVQNYFCSINPIFALGKYVLDKFIGNDPSPEEQRKTAIMMIKECKRQGAKEIEMTMDSGAAANLGSNIEGVPIKIGGRIGNKTSIKVKF